MSQFIGDNPRPHTIYHAPPCGVFYCLLVIQPTTRKGRGKRKEKERIIIPYPRTPTTTPTTRTGHHTHRLIHAQATTRTGHHAGRGSVAKLSQKCEGALNLLINQQIILLFLVFYAYRKLWSV